MSIVKQNRATIYGIKSQILNNEFETQLRVFGLPLPEREFKFHATRRWRFDFAYLSKKIAIEIDGGVYSYGRHNRPAGFTADREKINEAQKLGWQVFSFTSEQVHNLYAIDFIKNLLKE